MRENRAANPDACGYMVDWRSNILSGINPALIESDFGAGRGGELDSKLRAAHSSAALERLEERP